MKQEVKQLLAKAEKTLAVAKSLKGNGTEAIDSTVSRAYYALYQYVLAVARELDPVLPPAGKMSHRPYQGGPQHAVEHVLKRQQAPKHLLGVQRLAVSKRVEADYLTTPALTESDAEEALKRAETVIAWAKQKLTPATSP